MCEVDEDQETMFKLMETLRPLGIRDKKTNFDIVFPSRNQLKLYLARLIAKQRKQLRQGFLDDDSTEPNNRKTILSSTEFMEDKVISEQSMSLYASQLGIKHKSPRETIKKQNTQALNESTLLPGSDMALALSRIRGSSPSPKMSERGSSPLSRRTNRG